MQLEATNTKRWQTKITFADVMIYLHGIDIPRDVKLQVGKQLLFEADAAEDGINSRPPKKTFGRLIPKS